MAKDETQDVDTTDEGDAPLLDLNDASIKKMMARAEKRGTVTIDEINAAIPTDQNEMIEDIMSRLSERGVTVVENDEKSDDDEQPESAASYEFEPEPAELIAALLPRYISSRIFSGLLESAASESAARRRAMKSASDNATDLIKTYTRLANQARQAEITQEISEIVGGADALAASGSEA